MEIYLAYRETCITGTVYMVEAVMLLDLRYCIWLYSIFCIYLSFRPVLISFYILLTLFFIFFFFVDVLFIYFFVFFFCTSVVFTLFQFLRDIILFYISCTVYSTSFSFVHTLFYFVFIYVLFHLILFYFHQVFRVATSPVAVCCQSLRRPHSVALSPPSFFFFLPLFSFLSFLYLNRIRHFYIYILFFSSRNVPEFLFI